MKIGDKVICIKQGLWYSQKLYGSNVPCPTYLEVCLITDIDKDGLLSLAGYPNEVFGRQRVFNKKRFRPLLGQSATAELVSSFIEITETSDLPIRSPQTTEPCGS